MMKFHFIVKFLFYLSLLISLLVTIGIFVCLIVESNKFFGMVPYQDFFFGTKWNPHFTVVGDKITKLFGIIPLLIGTALVVVISMLIAGPIGLSSVIYINMFANNTVKNIIKPIIEILAGIPTVVYGYFAINVISPFVYKFGEKINLDISLESALSAGIAIGIMIIPLITSLLDDIIHAIPKNLYYGAFALGSTKTETFFKVMLPYSFSGLVSVFLLAVSRALGETMIVLMATGVASRLTFNPIKPVTTITVQIATLLTGDQTFSSVETYSAYALGLSLFVFTFFLNALALKIVKRYSNSN